MNLDIIISENIQDKIWNSIPDEYKNIIIKYYQTINNIKYSDAMDDGKLIVIEDIFGIFNIQNYIINDSR